MPDDYEDILKKSWDEMPEVHTLPVGTYRLRAQPAVYVKPKTPDQNPKVLFPFQVREPQDDVDADELEALGENYDITENKVFATFWVETAADWAKVRKFLAEKFGVDVTGKSLEESFKEPKGQEVYGYLKTRNYTNSQGELETVNEVTSITPVDD